MNSRVISNVSLAAGMLLATACSSGAGTTQIPGATGGAGATPAQGSTTGTTTTTPNGNGGSSQNSSTTNQNNSGGSSQASSQTNAGGNTSSSSSKTNAGGNTSSSSSSNTSAGGNTSSSSQAGGTKAAGGTSSSSTPPNTSQGGTSSTSTTSSSVGGSTSTSTDPLGGYHIHGDWKGFAFVYADGGATIDPPKETGFKTMTDKDGPYCVKGKVPGSATYAASAAVGFNTNQEKIKDAPTGKIVPSGTGLLVNVSNPGKSATLRVQIEDGTDPTSAEAPKHRWCVNISTFDKDVVIPWETFNTECWSGGKGTAFNPTTQLAKALVFLPGLPDSDVSFDYCVNKIGPDKVTGRGTGSIVANCGNSVSWAKTSSSARYENIATSDNKYRFQTNGWGWSSDTPSKHSISLSNSCGFKMDSQTCSRSDSSPCSFPSVYIGMNADGNPTAGNGLPKKVSDIKSAPTCLGWTAGSGASDEYNVSYDVWFNSNSGARGAEVFLMVWLRKPPTFQPAGSPKADGVTIGSQVWTVWYGPNASNQNVVSYVASPNDRAQGQAYSFNLKDFIDDAVERTYIPTDKYLIAVMGGMEIWGGASGASITSFKAEVQ